MQAVTFEISVRSLMNQTQCPIKVNFGNSGTFKEQSINIGAGAFYVFNNHKITYDLGQKDCGGFIFRLTTNNNKKKKTFESFNGFSLKDTSVGTLHVAYYNEWQDGFFIIHRDSYDISGHLEIGENTYYNANVKIELECNLYFNGSSLVMMPIESKDQDIENVQAQQRLYSGGYFRSNLRKKQLATLIEQDLESKGLDISMYDLGLQISYLDAQQIDNNHYYYDDSSTEEETNLQESSDDESF